jgi:hypothetical protein
MQRSGTWSDTNVATRPWALLNGAGASGVPGLTDTIVNAKTTITCNSSSSNGTSVSVNALTSPLLSGMQLWFGGAAGIVVTLTADAAIGATSISGTYVGTIANAATAKAGYYLIVDGTQSIGAGTAPTMDFSANNADSWISLLKITGSLTSNGGFYNCGDIIMTAGSSLTFSAATPNRFHNYNASTARKSRISIQGTSGSRCSIKGASTSARFGQSQASSFDTYTASYCDYQYVSSTTYQNAILFGGAETNISIDNCTFVDSYDAIKFGGDLAAASNCTISNCTFTGGHTDIIVRSGSATPTGTRLIQSCATGGGTLGSLSSSAGGWLGWTIDNYAGALTIASGTGCAAIATTALGQWTEIRNSFMRMPTTGSSQLNMQGNVTNCGFITDESTNTDPNCLRIDHAICGSSLTFKGNVYQAYSLDNNSAFIYTRTDGFSPAATTTINNYNSLLLPNINGNGASGSAFNCAGINANTNVRVDHYTVVGGGNTQAAGTYIGDGGVGAVVAGTINSFRANLLYGTAATVGSKDNALIGYAGNNVATDACAPANCGYNGGRYLHTSTPTWGPTAPGYVMLGTQAMFSSAPSANSFDVGVTTSGNDPQFVDTSRDFATAYTVYFGQPSAGTRAQNFQALSAYLLANVPNNPTKISGMISWIKGGWAPTNPLYNVTYPTDTNEVQNIGAIAGIFPSGHNGIFFFGMG